jgi:hypothetical protein
MIGPTAENDCSHIPAACGYPDLIFAGRKDYI